MRSGSFLSVYISTCWRGANWGQVDRGKIRERMVNKSVLALRAAEQYQVRVRVLYPCLMLGLAHFSESVVFTFYRIESLPELSWHIEYNYQLRFSQFSGEVKTEFSLLL